MYALFNDEYNNTASSLLFLNNGNNPPQTFASIFEQNILASGVFASHLADRTSSPQIYVLVFPANRATCALYVG